MTSELFVRWFLAIYFSGVAGFYLVTILAKRRRAGCSPVTPGPPGSLHCRVHRTFVIFRALIWGVSVARLADPGVDRWLLPFRVLWQPWVMLAGVGLLAAGFAAVVYVHNGMGADWRSGIEAAGPRRLITTGPFAFSRNPTFLAIQTAQLGLFLALPSLFTLVCLAVGIAAIHVQVRLEEAHLAARFGPAYAGYRKAVPRWLGRRRPPATTMGIGEPRRR